MNSGELNAAMETADERGAVIEPLAVHGKAVPYIGWFWRHIDFDCPDTLPLGDCGKFVGFMANNKWGYPQWCPSNGAEIVAAVETYARAIEADSGARAAGVALYELLQAQRYTPEYKAALKEAPDAD